MSDQRASQPRVYVQTNELEGNRVLSFSRAADGGLAPLGSHPTGGAGDGRPHLPSQGSLVLSGDGRHVLVTNAGSGDVSVLAVGAEGLVALGVAAAGSVPRSVAEHDGLVYVLATGEPAVLGFRLGVDGLEAIPGSRRALADGADPAQLGFAPDGRTLVVTERGANAIVRFPVGADGLLGEPAVQPSSGPTPYGFAFTGSGTLVVTEAFGARQGEAAASSYSATDGTLRPVSRSVGNGRSEICWAVVTPDGRYAFTTNFGDGAVSRYAIGGDGALALEAAVAGSAVDGQAGLRDEGLSRDGRFLYAVDADARRLFGWSVAGDGTLAAIGSWDGLPASVAGLAAV